ncbi:MAG: hypothetical protein WAP03_29205 [Methylorubrum rhodinum]|jgi:hypothetical protein|uniref:hypothetical protein n=1 Tax=Methylorubrum rhodinum TaxID=29428 RepID=UPI001055FE9A
MKAGNDNRVLLLGLDQAPWDVALGHDAAAEHVGGCLGLRDWLGVRDDATTVEDGLCRPRARRSDWVLVQHDDPNLATLLILNEPFATEWRAKRRGIRLRDLRDGEAFHGAIQEVDSLVTAYDQDALALAAFRPADRQLLADMAGALVAGRLAFADGGEGRVGPVLVLADRVPADALLRAIASTASSGTPYGDDDGIVYEVRSPWSLEPRTSPGPIR